MNVGKTLFAQVMEFVPWETFGRIVERHSKELHVGYECLGIPAVRAPTRPD